MEKYKKLVILSFQLMILLFITTSVYCQELPNEELVGNFGKPPIDYRQIIYAVLFLGIMIIAALFLIKKSNLSNTSDLGLIEIVYNYAITSKDKLLVAKVGKEYLLLGISNAGIRKLHILDKDYIHKFTSENNIKTKDFANMLINLVSKQRNA